MFHAKEKKTGKIYEINDLKIRNPVEDSRLYLLEDNYLDSVKCGFLKEYDLIEEEAKKQLENINNKEIHFFNFEDFNDCRLEEWVMDRIDWFFIGNSYSSAKGKIDEGLIKILTTQMALLNTSLFEKGYQIFIHDDSGIYEIKLGSDNKRTKREIRMCHDLFKLWESGEFRGRFS
jgi:hypothetical protein